jgi:ABC-type nickel/cobalt efflux system permease component RcnA
VLIVSLVVVGCWLLIVVQALMLRKMGKEAKEQKIPTSRKQTNIKAKTKRSRKAGKEKKKEKHKHKGTKNKSKVHRSSHKEIKETLPR